MRFRGRSRKSRAVVHTDRGALSVNQVARIFKAFHIGGVFENVSKLRYGSGIVGPRRGRPESIPIEAVLVVLAALIETGQAPLLTNVAQAMRHRLDYASAALLGLPPDIYDLTGETRGRTFWDVKGTDDEEGAMFVVSSQTLYDRTQAAFDRLASLVEPYRGVASREARPWADVARRLDELDPDEVEAQRRRLFELMNRIVRASLLRFSRGDSRTILRSWRGDIAVDSTKVPIHGPEGKGGVPTYLRAEHPNWPHHPEAMAGYYVRQGNHAGFEDDGVTNLGHAGLREVVWAYEAHVAVAITPRDSPRNVPNIALGVSFDSPAGRIAENSLTAVRSVTEVCEELGTRPGFIVSDRAIFPGSKYEKFQKPVREMDWKVAGDYRKDQLGGVRPPRPPRNGMRRPLAEAESISDPLRGLRMVEGDLYCPGMPPALVSAEADRRDGLIDTQTHSDRMARRELYLATRKERFNREGRGRFTCPAITPGGHVSCPLRGFPVDDNVRTEIEHVPEQPGDVCTAQGSVAVTLDDTTGKYAQDARYRSDEWSRLWGARNMVEGFNAALKEADHEDLENGARRRVIGFAKQALLVALMIYSVNVRRLRAFIIEMGEALTGLATPAPTRPAARPARSARRTPEGPAPPLPAPT